MPMAVRNVGQPRVTLRQPKFMERRANVSHQYRIEKWFGPAEGTPSRTAQEGLYDSQRQVKSLIVQIFTYKLFGEAITTRTAEVTICMILKGLLDRPRQLPKHSSGSWPIRWTASKILAQTNARHREIASTEVYPGNALSPLCRFVNAGQDGHQRRKHTRHGALLSCKRTGDHMAHAKSHNCWASPNTCIIRTVTSKATSEDLFRWLCRDGKNWRRTRYVLCQWENGFVAHSKASFVRSRTTHFSFNRVASGSKAKKHKSKGEIQNLYSFKASDKCSTSHTKTEKPARLTQFCCTQRTAECDFCMVWNWPRHNFNFADGDSLPTLSTITLFT